MAGKKVDGVNIEGGISGKVGKIDNSRTTVNKNKTTISIGIVVIVSVFLIGFIAFNGNPFGDSLSGTYVLEDGIGIGANELTFKGDGVLMNTFASTGIDLGIQITLKYKISDGTITLSETSGGAGISYSFEKSGNTIILNGSIYIKK